jgi:hypothetical protein
VLEGHHIAGTPGVLHQLAQQQGKPVYSVQYLQRAANIFWPVAEEVIGNPLANFPVALATL